MNALLERAARDGDRPGAAALERQAQAYLATGSHPETLLEFALALRADEARLAAGATAPATLGAAATDVLLAVLRAHLGAELRRRGELESSVATQAEIGIELFRPGHPDPRRLRWLAAAPVTAACLGLWDDGDDAPPATPGAGCTSPASTTRAAGSTASSVRRATPGDFPPAALRQRVAGRPGEAVVVVPVSTERRDWGLLAVIGSVEHRATSVRDTYNHWATLLAVALEQDELIESARRQRENLERAFARERELATSVRASEERYALVTRATDDGLWDWDVAAGVVYYSPRWKSMLGYGDDAGIGDGPHEWLDRVHPDDREELAAAIAAQLGGSSTPLEIEHRIRTAGGGHRWVLCRALTVHDDAGYPVRMVGALVDLADRKALEEQLSRGALYDAATGLPTRALFLDRLGLATARARRDAGYDFAVLVARVQGERRRGARRGRAPRGGARGRRQRRPARAGRPRRPARGRRRPRRHGGGGAAGGRARGARRGAAGGDVRPRAARAGVPVRVRGPARRRHRPAPGRGPGPLSLTAFTNCMITASCRSARSRIA